MLIQLSNGIQKLSISIVRLSFHINQVDLLLRILITEKLVLRRRWLYKTKKSLQFGPAVCKMEIAPLSDGKYDHSRQREAVAHWILMHEKPFSVVEEKQGIILR